MLIFRKMRACFSKSSANTMNAPKLDGNTDAQAILNHIVLDYLREQKRKRRGRWLVRGLIIFLLIFAYFNLPGFPPEKGRSNQAHVGLIDINGTIADSDVANSENFARSLDAAYKSKALKAIILRINSPGGSPVQADYMFNAIQSYRQHYPKIKIYAVCVDMCASAAYYVAAAADEIYANPASMVGSIGVLYNGFGFVDLLQKLGVTRRLKTAGGNKGFLDPFLPESPQQQQLLQGMLDDVHQQFIARVKEGRGSRLQIDEQTFSGLFWTGKQAKERGLIDGFSSAGQLAREIIKLNQVIDYTHKQTVFERVSKNLGTALANQLPLALGLKPGFQSKI